jgi:uncharacterized protein YndB with AHSA1/START domain
MSVLLYILVILLLLALVLVIFAMTKPNEFAIRRSISIHAPPQLVFSLIEDFRQWPAWSPWEGLDPAMRRTLSGAASGPGAVYEWEGNKKVGAGRMEILRTEAPHRVEIGLTFLRPFRADNLTTFSLVPAGDGTNVSWEMTGINSLMFKIMGIVMNMDRMVGRDFEKGLIAMKAAAERARSAAA